MDNGHSWNSNLTKSDDSKEAHALLQTGKRHILQEKWPFIVACSWLALNFPGL